MAIFSGLYRIEAGARYDEIFPWIRTILHESVIGAIPGQEALDIAWEAQAFLEKISADGIDGVLSSYDYAKYFDAFDHEWTKQLLLYVGMPPELVELMFHLYTNMERIFKKGSSLSEPFSAYNGYGQGDVLSLLPAMILVSWQFKMIVVKFPTVGKGAYYHDRNFRGTRETLVELDKHIHEFDKMAGHSTQADKTVLVCTNPKDRKILKRTKLGGEYPKRRLVTEIVGCMITAAKRKHCVLQDKRFAKTTATINRIISAPVGTARRIRAFCAKAIPAATYGMQWATPSLAMATRFRSRTMRCIWGNSSKMRCTEVVSGIINDPTRVDHYYAAAYRSILDVRRMLKKSTQRYDQFIEQLIYYSGCSLIDGVTGPAHGFIAK